MSYLSLCLDLIVACNCTPDSHLFSQKFTQLFGAAQRERHLLGLAQLRGDSRLAQRRGDLIAESVDYRLGRTCGRKYAPPGIGLEPGIALADCRDVRERRGAGLAGLCYRLIKRAWICGIDCAVLAIIRST